MGKPKAPSPSWPARFIREPLVQFVLLGAALFYVNYLITPDDRESIIVTQVTIDDLVNSHAKLQQADVSEVQRQELINGYIADEILVREAYKQGLDRDSQIRDLVLQKMRYVLEEEVTDPTPDQLRRCYESNRMRFHVSRTITLEQVYFPKSQAPEEDLLEKLQSGADHREYGEPIVSLERIKRPRLQRELSLHIGPDFARRVFELPPGEWVGPVKSMRGQHFVRVTEINPPREPSFQEVEPIIRREWPYFRPRQIVSEKVADFRKQYNIALARETSASATP